MGLLIKGQWHDQWYETDDGEFIREDAQCRNWVTTDGSAGPTGSAGFKAESGRYHLFVSLACPWAHRTLIFRALKDLTDHIGVTVVDPKMLEHGWEFSEVSKDNPLGDIRYMHQVYTTAKADYSGRVTVPVLWDKHKNTIVSNESSDIIRMFNSAFNGITGNDLEFYPQELATEIDKINELIYNTVNNGVYKAGFATSQAAYDKAYDELFATLDQLEGLLAEQRFLVGNKLTEADWRLFATLIRFDAVYYGHFKTNKYRIEDFFHLSNYVRELYQLPGIAETVDFEHIKTHYYYSHDTINPTRIIPKGPDLDYSFPHNRASLFANLKA